MKSEKVLTIVLPTYNEKDNVRPLFEEVTSAFSAKNYNYEILFVDDSNDETPKIINEISEFDNRVRMIHRVGVERTGLATAFIRGFKEAQGKYICCLDSDLQHPPKKIAVLLEEAIAEDADLVVASRYTKGGGGSNGLDGLYRKFISIAVRYFVHMLFTQTRRTTDPGSGFFLFKKEILEFVELKPRGFKILIEILMRAHYEKVSQIPYTFLPRKNEESKATASQGIEFLKHIFYIFRTVPSAGRFIKFSLVGGSGVVVNLGSLFVLVEYLSIDNNLAWLVAVLLSIANNFFLNNVFTYYDRKAVSSEERARKLIQYYFVSTMTMVLNFAIYSVGMAIGFTYMLSAAVAILFATILNYLLATKFVWKDSKLNMSNTNLDFVSETQHVT